MSETLIAVGRKMKSKYGLVIGFFLIWIFFFDEHNLLQQLQNRIKLEQLIEQEEFLKNKIVSDQQKIKELKTSQDNLEKFAREQFLMKKENEDIFVVVEE